jgi:hypothetical protein
MIKAKNMRCNMFGVPAEVAVLGFEGTPAIDASGFDGTRVSTTCISGDGTAPDFFAASTVLVASVA